MGNTKKNDITIPYEQYLGERVAPPTISLDYSNGTSTDPNRINGGEVETSSNIQLGYLLEIYKEDIKENKQEIEKLKNKLEKIVDEKNIHLNDFSSFKSEMKEKTKWQWIAISIIGTILGTVLINYIFSIIPMIHNIDKKLDILEAKKEITIQQHL